MKLRDQIVTNRAIAAWKELLKAAPAKSVLNFVNVTPPLRDGFRPGKIDHKTALQRTISLLDQTGEMHAGIKSLLCELSLERRLLSVMSEEAIEAAEPKLRDHFSPDILYASMLLSERSSLFERGIQGFEEYPQDNLTDEQRTAALEELRELFTPFLSVFSKSGFIGNPEDVANNNSELAVARDNVKALQEELQNLRRDLNQEKKGHDWHKSELSNLKSKLGAAEKKAMQCEAYLKSIKSNYKHLDSKFDQEVSSAVAAKVNERLLPWLAKSEALSLAVSESPADLLVRANRALHKQEESDRRFGTWQGLKQQLEDCNKMRDALRDAQKESLAPLSELRQLIVELEAESQRLQHALSLTQKAEQNSHLKHSIYSARTIEELRKIRESLRLLNELGLCSSNEVNLAYGFIHDKSSRIYAANDHENRDQPNTSYLPLQNLLLATSRNEECALVIDGHNVLHLLPSRYQDTFEGGFPGSKSRERLIADAKSLASTYPTLRVELWFDSNRAHDETICDNMSVHYSGGTGDHRADKKIIEQISFLRESALCRPIVLATADRDEAKQANGLGAIILAPEEFLLIL